VLLAPVVCDGAPGQPALGDSDLVDVNPPGQYADDRNLLARQRLWRCQVPFFDIAAWVLDLAGLAPGTRVLDAGRLCLPVTPRHIRATPGASTDTGTHGLI
jgi:hypothetical protein